MENNNLLFTIILCIVMLIAGFFVGQFAAHGAGYEKGYADGVMQQQVDFMEQVNKIYNIPPEPDKIFTYRGEIVKIDGHSFTLRVKISPPTPFHEEKELTKNVLIDSDTRIQKQTYKDETRYEKEKKEAAEMNLPEPLPYAISSASITELTVGAFVTVSSEEDIKEPIEFTASTVLLSL